MTDDKTVVRCIILEATMQKDEDGSGENRGIGRTLFGLLQVQRGSMLLWGGMSRARSALVQGFQGF